MPAGHVQPLAAPDSIIARSGRYALAGDRDRAVVVQADGVVIDLGGHRIAGDEGPRSQSAGIYIQHGRRDVRVVNGTISGFMYGVLADDGLAGAGTREVTLERLVLANNYFRGALLFASHATVERCVIEETGGTAVHADAYVFGLELRGDHSCARANLVREFQAQGVGEAAGICLSDEGMDHCVVERNVIVNRRLPERGRAFGAWIRNQALLRQNVFVNLTYAFAPPGYRTPANTIDNIVAGEQCEDGMFASTSRGAGTVMLRHEQPECLDCLHKARAHLDTTDAGSIVRLASLLEWKGDREDAARYFRMAANLGSAEGGRKTAMLADPSGRAGGTTRD